MSSEPKRRPPRSNEAPGRRVRRRLTRVQDRTLSVLSWVPSESFRVPAALILLCLPVMYLLVAPGGLLSGRTAAPAAPPARAAAPAAQMRAADEPGEPTRAPEADPFHENFIAMTQEFEDMARRNPSRVGIYVKDLQRGWEWSYHADDLFPAASLIKVPVMAGVFARIHEGKLSLNSKLKLRRRVRMGGSGTLKWSRDGTAFTVRRLLEKLIHESDNTAQLLLIDEIGMHFLQRFFPQIGLVYTEIYPEGLTLTGGRVRYENYTTAREMGGLLEKIYKGKVVDPFACELMLDIMKRRPTKSRLAKKLPVGWEIAHKTGLLRRACHDVGIVFSPSGDYVIAVMTGRNRSYKAAKAFITNIGSASYKHYRNEKGLFVRAPNGGKGPGRKTR